MEIPQAPDEIVLEEFDGQDVRTVPESPIDEVDASQVVQPPRYREHAEKAGEPPAGPPAQGPCRDGRATSGAAPDASTAMGSARRAIRAQASIHLGTGQGASPRGSDRSTRPEGASEAIDFPVPGGEGECAGLNQPERLAYRPALDGIRAVAVAAVVLYRFDPARCRADFWASTRSSCSPDS